MITLPILSCLVLQNHTMKQIILFSFTDRKTEVSWDQYIISWKCSNMLYTVLIFLPKAILVKSLPRSHSLLRSKTELTPKPDTTPKACVIWALLYGPQLQHQSETPGGKVLGASRFHLTCCQEHSLRDRRTGTGSEPLWDYGEAQER